GGAFDRIADAAKFLVEHEDGSVARVVYRAVHDTHLVTHDVWFVTHDGFPLARSSPCTEAFTKRLSSPCPRRRWNGCNRSNLCANFCFECGRTRPLSQALG